MSITAPGSAAWHLVLALLAPGCLALAGAVAARVAGRGRLAAVGAGVALLAAVAVLPVQLQPAPIAALTRPILDGCLAVGWIPTGTAAGALVACL